MIWLFYILNLAISAFNAWSVGKSWVEAKAAGGMARLMSWSGAIMSACGFTWCYMVLVAQVGVRIPGHYHLPEPWANGIMQLGYLVIILPIIGSGMAITVQSWMVFWRQRTFANGATMAWNTFAGVSNIYSAMRGIPEALSGLGQLFRGGSRAEKDEGGNRNLVFLVVVGAVILCLAGGILTTTVIVRSVARTHAVAIREQLRAARSAEGTSLA